MRITRLSTGFLILMFAALVANSGKAQVHYPQPHDPSGKYQPLIDPESFNPDYQLFQTVDYDPFHGTREYNTGFFGTYERVYLWFSRPDHEQSYTQGDWTWGNRYEVGYMTDEQNGWLVTHWHVTGPNANNILQIERLNRVNEDDDVGTPPPPDPTNPGTTNPVYPVQDRNNHFFDNQLPPDLPPARDYFLQDSLNLGNLSSTELNKTFRLEPYHNGSVLEPFVGLRYVRFIDGNINDSYLGPFDTNFGTPVNPTLVVAESLIRQIDYVENDMFGGQLGFRYFQNLERWQWSNEMRFFAMQNFQNQHRLTDIITTGYGDIGLGEEPVAERRQQINFYSHNQEFVFGLDLKITAAYQLTRDVSLRVGGEYMHFAQGIWRGPASTNDQDLIAAGVTMGIEFNR